MLELLPLHVIGHVHIEDDLGEVHLDKFNAVHPQNMARVMARALANESNENIYRIAFGNGGTLTDAAFTITFNTPNDGTTIWPPLVGRTLENQNGGADPHSQPGNAGTGRS